MIKKIKEFLAKQKQKQDALKQLDKAKKYYKALQSGKLFLDFIKKDMDAMKAKQMNRDIRRRFEREIYSKGQFSPEFIDFYSHKVDEILKYIDTQEKTLKNPPKPGAVRIEKPEEKKNV